MTHSTFALKCEVEFSAVGISVAVDVALGYVLEQSLWSTFCDKHARQASQKLLMQIEVAANMRLAHTVK
eukprot:5072225-Pleurochrysis_carterae.AAC.1